MVETEVSSVLDQTVEPDPQVKVDVRDLTIRYGEKIALQGVSLRITRTRDLRHHRSCQQRQDILPEGLEPNGSVHAWYERGGLDLDRRDGRPSGVKRMRSVGASVSYSRCRSVCRSASTTMSPWHPVCGHQERGRASTSIVETLSAAGGLWDEVKDRLGLARQPSLRRPAATADDRRALSQEPELLLLDEFSIAVDPVTTMRIEDVSRSSRTRSRSSW